MTATNEDALPLPEAAPAVVMDQRGNYWRLYPKGTLPGAGEDMLSMCPTSPDNYHSETIAIYRQGRDLSVQQVHDMCAQVAAATDDPLLRRAAENARQAWLTGRDMVTEAELLLEMIAIRAASPARLRAANPTSLPVVGESQ